MVVLTCPFSSPYNSCRPIKDAVFEHFATYRERIAIINSANGDTFTYDQVRSVTGSAASVLSKLGLKPGEVFAVYLENQPEFAFIFFAVTSLGGAVTGINPLSTGYEVMHYLEDNQARYLLTREELLPNVITALKQLPRHPLKYIFLAGKQESYSDIEGQPTVLSVDTLFAAPTSDVPQYPVDPATSMALVMYSSGTTGKPKGVMLSHQSIVSFLGIERDGVGSALPHSEDTVLSVLPFFHVAGVWSLVSTLAVGGRLLLMPKYERFDFVRCIERYRVTHTRIVPSILLFLAADPEVSKYDLSSLETIVFGAAPSGPMLVRTAKERFSKLKRLCHDYGLTETGILASTTAAWDSDSNYASIGYPVHDVQIKIVSTDGSNRVLGPNETGELWAKSPGKMIGYLNRPEATRGMMDKEGWIHTGDLAYFRENGQLVAVDRLKDLIKYKGFQVAPAELEDLILKHPGVREVGVCGLPSAQLPDSGLPAAFVVLKEGQTKSDKIVGEIEELVRENMANYKQLRGGIFFVDEIPKGASGKIMRRLLRDVHLKGANNLKSAKL